MGFWIIIKQLRVFEESVMCLNGLVIWPNEAYWFLGFELVLGQ